MKRAALFWRHPDSDGLTCIASAGDGDAERWLGRTLAAGVGMAGRAVAEGKPVWSPDLLADSAVPVAAWLRERLESEGLRSVAAAPIRAGGVVRGALGLLDPAGRTFGAGDLRDLGRFADDASLDLERAIAPELLTSTETGEAQTFYRELERNHLVALWSVATDLLPKEPRGRAIPHLWRWDTLLPLVRRAGELAPISRGAERRVLGFINPGLPSRYGATHTLWAGFQYLLPREVAPAHRHSPAAIRFIIQGDGAFTTVDGDKCVMSRGDLVLTPPWTWHDHGNESDEPMIWLDGLDLPLVAEMEATFFEPFPQDAQRVARPAGDSERRYGIGQLRPTWERWAGPSSPLLNYKWAQTEEALRRLATVGGSPYDDVAMEYINPHTGGPLMPTIACWSQLIRAGVRTQAHRHTGSAVYLAFDGAGHSVIDGQRFDWRKGDLFVVPTWAWHEHASAGGADAILFSVRDTPVMQALGLYREEGYPDHGGHQPVTRVFEG